MSTKKRPLEELDPNIPSKKPRQSKGDVLQKFTPEQARQCIDRLTNGFQDRGQGYGPALINPKTNCLLPQKGLTRTEGGVHQISMISTATRGAAGSKRAELPKSNAPRLVVWAKSTEEERRRFIEEDEDASHLCHESRCIREDHIIGESKARNQGRKTCAKEFIFTEVEVEGEMVRLDSEYMCSYEGHSCLRVFKAFKVTE